MRKLALFFDTETNGLPTSYKAPVTQVNNWPRVIQLAWQIADLETEELVKEYKTLILPDGWVVPTGDFWVNHGYSTAINKEHGLAMGLVLDEFIKDLNICCLMVAHNIDFDHPVLGAEMIRYQKRADVKLAKICTMKTTIGLCQLRRANSSALKFPKLEELFYHLFKESFQGAHDAGNDVTACRLAFFELLKRNVITLPENIPFRNECIS